MACMRLTWVRTSARALRTWGAPWVGSPGARVGLVWGLGGARVAFVYKGWHVSIVGQGTFVHVKGFGQLHDVLQGAAVHSAAQCCGLV